jgi:NADH dehydrogenase
VRVVTRSLERAKNLRAGAYVGQVVPVLGDISKPDNFAELLNGSYAVINLVGLLYERGGNQKFSNIHAKAVEKLAKAAKAAKVQKFTHVSAIVPENSESKYAQTKIAGENSLQLAFPDAVILKPSVVFGAEDNFFNQFAKMATLSPFLPLIGGGKTRFQPVYVGDVAKAVVNSLSIALPGSYQLGGPQVLTFKEILQSILQYTNRKSMFISIPFFAAKIMAIPAPSFILTRDQVELLKHDNIISTRSKGLKELGVKPTAIEAIVPEFLARYRKKTISG